MPSNKSAAEKVREERELARKNRKHCLILYNYPFLGLSVLVPPVRYDMSLLRKAINSQTKTSANGAKELVQSFFDSETDDGGDGK